MVACCIRGYIVLRSVLVPCLPPPTNFRPRRSSTEIGHSSNRVSPTTNAPIAALDHRGGLAGWPGPDALAPPLAHASVLRLGRPPRPSEGCAERGSGRGFRRGVPTGAHERRRRPVPCTAPPGGRSAGAARRRPRTLARLRDSAASTWPVRAACVRADGGGTVARGARRRGGRAARRRGRGRPRHPRARRAARGAAARGHLSARASVHRRARRGAGSARGGRGDAARVWLRTLHRGSRAIRRPRRRRRGHEGGRRQHGAGPCARLRAGACLPRAGGGAHRAACRLGDRVRLTGDGRHRGQCGGCRLAHHGRLGGGGGGGRGGGPWRGGCGWRGGGGAPGAGGARAAGGAGRGEGALPQPRRRHRPGEGARRRPEAATRCNPVYSRLQPCVSRVQPYAYIRSAATTRRRAPTRSC